MQVCWRRSQSGEVSLIWSRSHRASPRRARARARPPPAPATATSDWWRPASRAQSQGCNIYIFCVLFSHVFAASEVPVGLTPAAVCSSGRALRRVSPGGWRPNCLPAWVSASLQSALFCYKICKYVSYDEYLPGRRNPLRMLSNAIDFRTRRKHRPKSADFENPEDGQSQSDTRSQCSAGTLPLREAERPGAGRSASVTDLLECVSLSPGQQDIKGAAEVIKGAAKPRVLEGRNSAPDMLRPPGDSLGLQAVATLGSRGNRARARLSAGSETWGSYVVIILFWHIFFFSGLGQTETEHEVPASAQGAAPAPAPPGQRQLECQEGEDV